MLLDLHALREVVIRCILVDPAIVVVAHQNSEVGDGDRLAAVEDACHIYHPCIVLHISRGARGSEQLEEVIVIEEEAVEDNDTCRPPDGMHQVDVRGGVIDVLVLSELLEILTVVEASQVESETNDEGGDKDVAGE